MQEREREAEIYHGGKLGDKNTAKMKRNVIFSLKVDGKYICPSFLSCFTRSSLEFQKLLPSSSSALEVSFTVEEVKSAI